MEETLNMASFISTSLSKINKPEPSELEATKEKVQKLKIENSILSKNNESLVAYIDERKKYSESLKAKIGKLKEEIK